MSRKSILVVEDDQDIRESFKDFLEGEGYHVLLASNGKDALELLRSEKIYPGLVLLDLMMPVMDGKTFLQELEKDPTLRKLPVVVCTAAAEKLSFNIVGLMKKPVDLDKVTETVVRYCGA
jgi:CheY-like chemotaxis protein